MYGQLLIMQLLNFEVDVAIDLLQNQSNSTN